MDILLKKTDELIRNALKAWGIKEFNIESIDPLVRLLIACVADESHKLENKMSETASNIEQLLLNSILPWRMTSSRPAYAMIHALPLEPSYEFDENQTFIHEKTITINGTREQIGVFFNPVLRTRIFRANISYLFNGIELHAYNAGERFYPEKQSDARNSIWLGIQLDDSLTSLNGFNLFVHPQKSWFDHGDIQELSALGRFKVYHNKQELMIREGLKLQDLISPENNSFKNRSQSILSYFDLVQSCFDTYQRNSFKIYDHDPIKFPLKKQKHPVFFKELFDIELLDQFSEKLLWLELRFPESSPLMARQANVFINTFPVININRQTIELAREEPIVKINTEKAEEFIGVLDFDAFDMFHNSLNLEKNDVVPYILRSIEMEQFTVQDAANKLEKIIDGFENSFHVFYEHFSMDHDDIERLHTAIKPIRESLLNVKKNRESSGLHYLLFNPENKKEIESIQLKYLSTHGELGNEILQGDVLKTNSTLIDAKSLRFVTKTRGGSKPLHNEEKKKLVQSLLTSHNQIVTKDDIVKFCHLNLAEKLKDITVADATMLIGNNLRKCLKVNLALDKDMFDKEDAGFIRQEIEHALQRKANTLVPVKVMASLV